MQDDRDDVVIAGHVAGPFGVRGWVRIVSYTDPWDGLLDYQPWLIERTGAWQEAAVVAARRHGDTLLARFEHSDDRDAAQALAGARLGFARSRLPATAPNEFYWRDLVGLAVVDRAGRVLGTVDHLIGTGAHDVLVVTGAGGEVLIPFHERFVIAVRPGEAIEVDWED